MTLTGFSLFAGGGGADIGMMAAGISMIGAIEYDADIAAWYARNLGDHVAVADVREVDPANFPGPDVLWASPPCPSFSVAKTGTAESDTDIELARAVVRFIRHMRPRYFFLENVWGYRRSKSWAMIRNTLYECGYWLDVAHLNAADFGVPQSRRRMIVRGVRNSWVPMLPPAEPHRGWYQAIEDLIPALAIATRKGCEACEAGTCHGHLAPWQEARLGDMRGTRMVLVSNGGTDTPATLAADDPALAGNGQSGGRLRIVDGGNAGRRPTIRDATEPMFTVDAMRLSKHPKYVVGPRFRIAKATPRCLARWQTFPDWYDLPTKATLASRIIGNAVPCLMAEKIVKATIA